MPAADSAYFFAVPPEQPVAEQITQLLERVAAGEEGATSELFDRIYARLRAIALGSGLDRRHTLHATALVHEAYLKLFDGEDRSWHGADHFFAAAAQAMRQIAVDHARARLAQKRGGDWQRVTLSGVQLGSGADTVDVIQLDEAMAELAALSARQARIVELRFFGGLTIDQAAAVLGVSPRTVDLEWRTAKAWLRARLSGDEP